MLLIKELTEEVRYLKEEAEEGKKNYFIEGIIMQGGITNRNRRCYPMPVLEKEVNRYIKTYIDQKRAYGELGHPASPTINLDRVSHYFTELKTEGKNIVGRAKVMDTPMGNIVKNFIDEGTTLAISSRGMASLKEVNGVMEVQDNFMLATAGDIVSDPSAPDAFVKGVMEGRQWIYDVATGSWVMENTLDQIEDEVKGMSRKELEENALRLFTKFMKSL